MYNDAIIAITGGRMVRDCCESYTSFTGKTRISMIHVELGSHL